MPRPLQVRSLALNLLAEPRKRGMDGFCDNVVVPHRWWAGMREEAAEEGGVRYAATPAVSPSYYGLRLLHSFLHPDLVLRLDRGECRAGATSGGSRSYALVPADELSRALAR